MRAVITTLVLLWLALLSGVANAGSRAQARTLETTQAAYTAAVRWNDFDTAQGFVEPAYAQAHPLSDLERSRYEQIQISGYRELRVSEDPNATCGASRIAGDQPQYPGRTAGARHRNLALESQAEALVAGQRPARFVERPVARPLRVGRRVRQLCDNSCPLD